MGAPFAARFTFLGKPVKSSLTPSEANGVRARAAAFSRTRFGLATLWLRNPLSEQIIAARVLGKCSSTEARLGAASFLAVLAENKMPSAAYALGKQACSFDIEHHSRAGATSPFPGSLIPTLVMAATSSPKNMKALMKGLGDAYIALPGFGARVSAIFDPLSGGRSDYGAALHALKSKDVTLMLLNSIGIQIDGPRAHELLGAYENVKESAMKVRAPVIATAAFASLAALSGILGTDGAITLMTSGAAIFSAAFALVILAANMVKSRTKLAYILDPARVFEIKATPDAMESRACAGLEIQQKLRNV